MEWIDITSEVMELPETHTFHKDGYTCFQVPSNYAGFQLKVAIHMQNQGVVVRPPVADATTEGIIIRAPKEDKEESENPEETHPDAPSLNG